jgi:DNA polymerase III gamma/tau subunit
VRRDRRRQRHGRLEIDADAYGRDNVREVIISGSASCPCAIEKVFIIDEVHQLSSSSFNALLKPIEEPPDTWSS